MKYTILIILLFNVSLSCISQETAVTKDGKKVLLYENGTWKYIQDVEGVKMPDSSLKKFSRPAASKTLLASKRTDHAIWYDATKWALSDMKVSDVNEYLFKLKNEDAYCMTVVEKIEIPIDNFKNIVLKSLEMKGLESVEVLDEDFRMVNGQRVLQLQFTGSLQGMRFTYMGYYFSNESGTSQILCYTSANLFKQYKAQFENMLNGFTVQLTK